ncbi:TolC family protein [uncultured Fusobacterium sp.]|jgi:outer membrane protein TolC|uniref:TolC family protein n=1 Tax=uncultured Fusobacterium sp. TaxID=159267 RepID=UPI0015A593CE|nr:TolC family protein [uncultured Fusobacterium sp.]
MKKKIIILIALGVILGSCSNLKKDYQKIDSEIKTYKELSKNYNIDSKWWESYGDEQLNNLIELGLKNNSDLAKAAININKALYQAKIIGSDLVPEFSGNLGSSASKNIESGGNSNIDHSGSFNISYEVDLWQRLRDMKDAQEWEYKATIEDYEKIKLTLINSIIDSYFSIIYLENYIEINKNMSKNYLDIEKIVENKLRYGTVDILDKKQAEREVIRSNNTLISYEKDKKEQESLLRNLLNLKPDDELKIEYRDILKVKNLGVNLDVPLNIVASRPDIKAYEYRLKNAFKDAVASEKQLYPNITISSALSSSSNKFNNTLKTPVALGSVSINLPFLNWNEIKWNIKINRAEYEEAKLNFQQRIVTALNEIDYNYFLYVKEQENYINLKNINEYDNEIAINYERKYENGKVELREWLLSLNDEASSRLNIINSKYQLIKIENTIYQSIGGMIKK